MAYDGPLLLLSVAVAVAASALALGVVGRRASAGASSRALVGAGLAMGAAIAGMHYLGMAGLRVPAALTHRPALVVASVGIAVGASFAALGLAFRLRNDDVHSDAAAAARRSGGRRLGAAAVMGAAIAGMHYTPWPPRTSRRGRPDPARDRARRAGRCWSPEGRCSPPTGWRAW
jgi:NO-binding membrane sensor protein with MHYT domain